MLIFSPFKIINFEEQSSCQWIQMLKTSILAELLKSNVNETFHLHNKTNTTVALTVEYLLVLILGFLIWKNLQVARQK